MPDNFNNTDGGQDKNLPVECLVSLVAGKAVADSRVIAKKFQKRHNDVLRDIDRLVTAVKLHSTENWGQRLVEKRGPHPTIKEGVIRYFELDHSAFSLFASEYLRNDPILMTVEFLNAFCNATDHLATPRNIRTIH